MARSYLASLTGLGAGLLTLALITLLGFSAWDKPKEIFIGVLYTTIPTILYWAINYNNRVKKEEIDDLTLKIKEKLDIEIFEEHKASNQESIQHIFNLLSEMRENSRTSDARIYDLWTASINRFKK